ncbi:pyrimidine-specific ribonucleoside hydrolase RihB [Elysia marginata]|uniref:Pyrimidine-specific ribonucleoside hydrolase RihB n=1 Tax=Elysia marginata TaxID=1093978 RepID=A0AAV4HAH1_9GAST|nr:pyrimidine-specific ribonucleoside hydrolase RihB [Elysia marginata]
MSALSGSELHQTKMEKGSDSGDLTPANVDNFRIQFSNYVREYCGSAQNSSTITAQKRDRIIKYLKNSKSEPSARFRFWVRSKGYRIVQITDEESILAVPPKPNTNDSQNLFRRVPITDEFFDIIYAAHCENGHVGQSQTFSAVKAMYALIPRVMIIKFIEMCPQCSTSHIYMAKRRRLAAQQGCFITADKLAGAPSPFGETKKDSDHIQDDTFEEAEDAVDHQQDMASALSDLLSGKITSPDLEGGCQVDTEDLSTDPANLAFSCHLCKQVFNKRKALQKHITSHQDYRPSVAIFLASSRPDIDLMAINCVAGNVSVLNACENTLRVLKACGREDVHVCRGAEKSLLGQLGKSENLPGIAWTRKVEGNIQAEHSVSYLIRCVNENPGEISLICLGPLTNLALALRLDPLVVTNLRELIIVGGNIEGQGDVSLCSEQNFLFDPEAAHMVLQEVQNAFVLPYEVSQRHKIPFKPFITWLNAGSDISNFLIESVTQEELQQQAKTGVTSPELFAVAIVIDASILLEKEKLYATVELTGHYSRGLMILDKRNQLGKEANIFVLKNLDLGKTQALFGALFVSRTVSVNPQQPIVCLAGNSSGSKEHTPILFKEAKVTIL